jgi:DNA-binding NtrC family response regulator
MSLDIHICFLDDDKDQLDLILETFRKKGITRVANVEIYTNIDKFLAELHNMNIGIFDHHLGAQRTGFNIVEEIHKHNQQRRSIAKIKVIIMSATTDVHVPIRYMNEKKAAYFAHKYPREGSFYENLVAYTLETIEDVKSDLLLEAKLKNGETIIDKWTNESVKAGR